MNKLQMYFFSQHIKEAEESKKKGLSKMQQAALLGGGAALVGLGGLGYALHKGAKKSSKAIQGAQATIDSSRRASQEFAKDLDNARKADAVVANETRQAFKSAPNLSDSSGFGDAVTPKKSVMKETLEFLHAEANKPVATNKSKNPFEGYETVKITPEEFASRAKKLETPQKPPSLGKPLSISEYSQKFKDLGAETDVPPEDMQRMLDNLTQFAKTRTEPEKVMQRTYDEMSNRTELGSRLYKKFLDNKFLGG